MLAFSITFWESVWTAVAVLCYPLTWLLIPWVLLKPVVHPSARIAWILTILFVPYLGAVVALVFGVNQTNRHKDWKRQAAKDLRKKMPGTDEATTPDVSPQLHAVYEMAKSLTSEPLTAGNRVTLYNRTPDAFQRIESAIRSAQQTLHISFYIWRNDRIGSRLSDLLIEKARAGIKVRFLYDEIGSLWLTRKYLRHLKKNGIETASFLAGSSFQARWSLNLRSHRKSLWSMDSPPSRAA